VWIWRPPILGPRLGTAEDWDRRGRVAEALQDASGLRMDYMFTTPSLANSCTSAEIDCQERKGEKPSYHAPVVALLAANGYKLR
jgi:exodeoxyribonuclease-3